MALSESAIIEPRAQPSGLRAHPWVLAWGGVLAITVLIYLARAELPWLWATGRSR